MRWRVRLAFLTLMVVSGLNAFAPATAHQGEAAKSPAAALRLVELVYPKESLTIFQPGFPQNFAKKMVQTPQGARLEQRFPGFALRFALAAQPTMEDAMSKRLPTLHRELMNVYAAELTEAEMSEVTAFFSSGPGRKFVADALARVQIGTLVAGSAMGDIAGAREEATLDAAIEAFDNASDIEKAAIAEFLSSSVGRKSVETDHKARPILDAWQAHRDPVVEARISETMMRVAKEIQAEQARR